MPRANNNPASRKRRKRILEQAKGARGSRSKLIRMAYGTVEKAGQHAYKGRKLKKRNYRALWTIRINAACRELGMNYSQFIHGLKLADIDLNRKVLADVAAQDPAGFAQIVEQAKAAIAAKA